MSQLLKHSKFAVAYTLIAAASNTDQKTTFFDMSEFDGIMFITPVTVETNTGVLTVDAHGDTQSSGATSAIITGATAVATSTGANTAGTAVIVDVSKPLKRYVGARLRTSVANMTLGPTIAILYMAHNKPTVQDATIIASTAVLGS